MADCFFLPFVRRYDIKLKEMSPEDPIHLIKKIVNKDREAFKRFYDHYAPLAYSLALRILRNDRDAEEAVQDAFYKVWETAEKYDESRGKPEAWIISITRSRAIDRLRQIQRQNKGAQPLEESRGEENLQESGYRDPKEGRAKMDARLSLSGILARISEDHRQALELAYFEGLTQSEIAVRLDLPLGTVKTRMRDGLKKLRELVKEKGKIKQHEP